MTLDAGLAAYMVQPVSWTPAGARTGSGFGDRSAGATTKTVLCRVERGGRRITSHGQQTDSTVLILARPQCTDGTAFTPSLKDAIVLPAGYNPQSPAIIEIAPQFDEVGSLHHVVIHA